MEEQRMWGHGCDPQDQLVRAQAGAALGLGAAMMSKAGDPWKHRSDGMRCKTCMWFSAKPPTAMNQTGAQNPRSYDVGRCRRHAPAMGGYPVVFVNDWCGDHRLDENKV